MMKYCYLISETKDAYTNLACDEYLLGHLPPDVICLLMYVNENAVIIGQNQNPYAECDISAMERDGVQLVRRLSGGGAVYHDAGNLNFSFHTPRGMFGEDEQNQLICNVLEQVGIHAEVSGRNDLTVGGRKISGTAFCHRAARSLRHGTLLVRCDGDKMSRYLTPSVKKLEAKGVKSVRNRVGALADTCPDLTVHALNEAIVQSFCSRFELAEELHFSVSQQEEIALLAEQNRSFLRRFGQTPPYTATAVGRFSFGTACLNFYVTDGRITECVVDTDALDVHLATGISDALRGVAFVREDVEQALRVSGFEELISVISSCFD